MMRFNSSLLAPLGLMTFALLSGCGGGFATSNLGTPGNTDSLGNPPQVTRGQSGTLLFTLSTPKTIYAVGEDVHIEYTLTNTGSEPVDVVGCVGLGTAYVMQGEVPLWRDLRGGGAGCVPRAQDPGETKRDSIIWNQSRNEPIATGSFSQVPPGTYRIFFSTPGGYTTTTLSLVVTIR